MLFMDRLDPFEEIKAISFSTNYSTLKTSIPQQRTHSIKQQHTSTSEVFNHQSGQSIRFSQPLLIMKIATRASCRSHAGTYILRYLSQKVHCNARTLLPSIHTLALAEMKSPPRHVHTPSPVQFNPIQSILDIVYFDRFRLFPSRETLPVIFKFSLDLFLDLP